MDKSKFKEKNKQKYLVNQSAWRGRKSIKYFWECVNLCKTSGNVWICTRHGEFLEKNVPMFPRYKSFFLSWQFGGEHIATDTIISVTETYSNISNEGSILQLFLQNRGAAACEFQSVGVQEGLKRGGVNFYYLSWSWWCWGSENIKKL